MEVNNQKGNIREYDAGVKNEFSQDLDKEAFLKLLTTQMSNQDPLNPMEDREFIAQMAQFSSLEQMQNLNHNFQSEMKEIKEVMKNKEMSMEDHITAMNNNLVASQSMIINTLVKIAEEAYEIEIDKNEKEEDKIDPDKEVDKGEEIDSEDGSSEEIDSEDSSSE